MDFECYGIPLILELVKKNNNRKLLNPNISNFKIFYLQWSHHIITELKSETTTP